VAPTFDAQAFLSAVTTRDDKAATGLRGFLSAIGWRGVPLSRHFMDKRKIIFPGVDQ
jgi:hypothetical protein